MLALEILISVYVVGMLRVLYGFGTVIGVLVAKKPKEQVLETFDTPQGEGRGGYLPAQEYHFNMENRPRL